MAVTKPKPQIDPELLAEMEEDRKGTEPTGGGGKYESYKVEEDGKPHAIRVLPGTFGKSKKKFYAKLSQHWLQFKGRNTVFDCPDFHFGEECPVCEKLRELRELEKSIESERKPDLRTLEVVRAQIRRCLPRYAYALNIVDREEEGHPIVRLYRAPTSVFTEIEGAFLNNGDVILDPDDGYDFILRRFKRSGRTTYRCDIEVNPCRIDDDDDVIEELLKNVYNLDEIAEKPSFENLVLALEEEMDRVRDSVENGGSGAPEISSRSRGSDSKLAEMRERRSSRSGSIPPSRVERESDGDDDPPARPSRPSRPAPRSRQPEPPDDDPEPQQTSSSSKLFSKLRDLQSGHGDDSIE